MDKKTATLKVMYTYKVTYGHEEHLAEIKRDLEKAPIHGIDGAGVASDGKVHSYSCERKGKGVVITMDDLKRFIKMKHASVSKDGE